MLGSALAAASLSLLLACLAWLGARSWVDRQQTRRESGLPLAWFRIAYSGLDAGLRRVHPLAALWTEKVARPLAGITRHGVFMDHHFRGYDEVISVASVDAEGRETLLPFWEPSGAPTSANSGRLWVFWNWRVVGTRPDHARVADGVRRLTAFWSHERQIPLDRVRFVIRSKRIEVPKTWASGWLRRERARPWTELGRAHWTGGRFRYESADRDFAGQRAALPPLARSEDRGGLP